MGNSLSMRLKRMGALACIANTRLASRQKLVSHSSEQIKFTHQYARFYYFSSSDYSSIVEKVGRVTANIIFA